MEEKIEVYLVSYEMNFLIKLLQHEIKNENNDEEYVKFLNDVIGNLNDALKRRDNFIELCLYDIEALKEVVADDMYAVSRNRDDYETYRDILESVNDALEAGYSQKHAND